MAPFYIQCTATGLVLDIKDGSEEPGSEVIMWPYSGSANQLWKYKDGMIHSRKNKELVLDINMQNKKIIVWPAHGSVNQKWTFHEDHTLVSDTGDALDVDGGSEDKGTNLISYSKSGSANQCFRVVFVRD